MGILYNIIPAWSSRTIDELQPSMKQKSKTKSRPLFYFIGILICIMLLLPLKLFFPYFLSNFQSSYSSTENFSNKENRVYNYNSSKKIFDNTSISQHPIHPEFKNSEIKQLSKEELESKLSDYTTKVKDYHYQ